MKIGKLLFTILISYFMFLPPVFASTNTKERTEADYLVPSDVVVTDSNKENVLTTPAIDASEKVYDFANLFTEEEEQDLYQKITTYINSYEMDFALVTINENPKNWEVYADDFYDYNDFKADGILFLIDMDNRQLHMSTSGNAIRMYTDARINTALDSVYSYMTNQNYYEGVTSYLEIVSNQASSGYPSGGEKEKPSLLSSFFIAFTVASIITIIIMLILVGKNKLARKATTAKQYLVEDSVKITNIGEIFLGTHTVRHKIEHSSSSGGGSSTHTSSSGSSHGGGSHGF